MGKGLSELWETFTKLFCQKPFIIQDEFFTCLNPLDSRSIRDICSETHLFHYCANMSFIHVTAHVVL